MPDYTRTLTDQPPRTLRQLSRWLRWQLKKRESGKFTKVPDRSVIRDPLWSWVDVEDDPRSQKSGVGFCFTGGVEARGGYVVLLDLDACRNPITGEISAWAVEIIERYAGTYTAVSPSGTGLHVILIVATLPEHVRAMVRIPDAAPEGVNKKPELQIFGLGVAQFATITGERLEATLDEPLVVPDLDWLLDRWDMRHSGDRGVEELPRGEGAAPAPRKIRDAILAMPDGEALLAGRWHEVVKSSASEAFFLLVQMVLRAAEGHGMEAADFIANHTVWGRGEVEDSKDPSRYARREWIERDVCRAAGKTRAADPAEVFEALDDEEFIDRVVERVVERIIDSGEFIRRRSEQLFTVHGALPHTGLAQFFGDPGCGKTPFAMSLAIHVAAGLPTWMGHDLDAPGRVLYMVGEDANGLGWRYEAQCKALGLDLDEMKERLLWTTQPGALVDTKDVQSWRDEIVARVGRRGLRVLVVDTQSRNFGVGDENSTEDMTRFVNNLAQLAEQLGILIVLVHHKGHSAKDRGRGSSVLFGALDAAYDITREGMEVVATSKKAKNWADPEPIYGLLTPHTVGEDEKGRPITAVTLSHRVDGEMEPFGEIELDDFTREVGEVLAAATPGVSQRDVAGKLRTNQTKVNRAVSVLVGSGMFKRGKGKTLTPTEQWERFTMLG